MLVRVGSVVRTKAGEVVGLLFFCCNKVWYVVRVGEVSLERTVSLTFLATYPSFSICFNMLSSTLCTGG